MSKNSQQKEIQQWENEKPRRVNARRLNIICRFAPEILEFEEIFKNAKKIGIAHGVSSAMQVASVLKKHNLEYFKCLST